MAIQATGGRPLVLNHYLTDLPEKVANDAERKAFTSNVIAKITYTAIVAICASVLAFSLFAVSVSGALPLVLLGLALSTPLLAIGAAKLQAISNNHSHKAAIERGVAEELSLIKDWKEDDVKEFFNAHSLPLIRLPVEELKKLNSEEPLIALLPLIARFQYFIKQSLKHEETYKKNIAFQNDNPLLRIHADQIALDEHSAALAKMLEASLFLPVISMPQMELSLSDIGSIKDKTERVFDLVLRKNDDYLIYHDKNRLPLKQSDIEMHFNPDDLWKMLLSSSYSVETV